MKSTSVTPALTGGAIRIAGHAHDPGRRLDGQVHRQRVAVRSGDAEAGAGGVDQSRVDLTNDVPADAETIHGAGREIFQQHVGPPDQLEQQLAAFRGFQVQRDRPLVGVQHGERQGDGHARRRAMTQRLAVRRFDLDDVGARLRQQEAGIGPLEDLPEIQHRDVAERGCSFAGV